MKICSGKFLWLESCREVVLKHAGMLRATACAAQEQAESLHGSFEAPLREAVRAVRGAKGVMGDRSAALAALQAARAEVDGRRTKLAKLRGTPGIKARANPDPENPSHQMRQGSTAATPSSPSCAARPAFRRAPHAASP